MVDRTLAVHHSRTLGDQAATEALGAELGAQFKAPTFVHLEGDLGAGKSTFARGMLRSWGVTGPVRSPTYTLIETYDTEQGTVHHLDLYRLGDSEELYYLGLEDLLTQDAVWLIEWPALGEDVLPPPDWHVAMDYSGEQRTAVWRHFYRVK
ncbi:MAG: tRNA (adenosine(37)-N6)-threonylcarbamoyltransferase complex ATPase subunit type 1 TsaE [Granulosicoccaceae bacterium]